MIAWRQNSATEACTVTSNVKKIEQNKSSVHLDSSIDYPFIEYRPTFLHVFYGGLSRNVWIECYCQTHCLESITFPMANEN